MKDIGVEEARFRMACRKNEFLTHQMKDLGGVEEARF